MASFVMAWFSLYYAWASSSPGCGIEVYERFQFYSLLWGIGAFSVFGLGTFMIVTAIIAAIRTRMNKKHKNVLSK